MPAIYATDGTLHDRSLLPAIHAIIELTLCPCRSMLDNAVLAQPEYVFLDISVRLQNGDLEWTVEPYHPPLRIDHYLKIRLPSYGRGTLQRYIREGGVKRRETSGQLIHLKPATKVRPGDVLRIKRPEPPPRAEASEPRSILRVLYEDESLVVVDKPAGMLVHPTGVHMDGTVIGVLRERYQEKLDLAHRLDRETSGVLVLTRTLEATREMKRAFKERRIHKRYLAVVRGCPQWDTRCVTLPMGNGTTEVRMRQVIREDGAPARTTFRTVERISSSHALIEARPETGRLHQIRVHLEAVGLSLVGDKIYGGDGKAFLEFYESGLTPGLLERLGHWRHALHAHEMVFNHPLNGGKIHITAPLAEDLVDLVRQLAGYSSDNGLFPAFRALFSAPADEQGCG